MYTYIHKNKRVQANGERVHGSLTYALSLGFRVVLKQEGGTPEHRRETMWWARPADGAPRALADQTNGDSPYG